MTSGHIMEGYKQKKVRIGGGIKLILRMLRSSSGAWSALVSASVLAEKRFGPEGQWRLVKSGNVWYVNQQHAAWSGHIPVLTCPFYE